MKNPSPIRITSEPATQAGVYASSSSAMVADQTPPKGVLVPGKDAPVRRIDANGLFNLGQKLNVLWMQYRADRRIAELRWMRNERQYLGIYDPEVDKELMANRSRAYPRITRVKCISFLARLMNLMFPGDERNWEIRASPTPNMKPDDIKQAIQDRIQKDKDAGATPNINLEYVMGAVQQLANKRAEELCTLIDDQLEELGGDQTCDYVQLNRKVLQSGVVYGVGYLKGPYAKTKKVTVWKMGPDDQPVATTETKYLPMFEFLKVWDVYPDMAAKTFEEADGHFVRKVMSRSHVLALREREDFFEEQIDQYLASHQIGNYIPLEFEQELRTMGVRVNVNEFKTETAKYEIIIWHGKTDGAFLRLAGVPVPEDKITDEIDAEVWMIDGNVIGAKMNPWVELGVDVKTLHHFLFDEDDTSPVGFGLPNAIRDSQMGVAAAARMLMDNASVVCGPNLELNTDLLRPDQDLSSTSAYKIWYRTGDGPDAQFPAVRDININAHLEELTSIIELWMKFADQESFIGPGAGGDNAEMPSEPMRTMGGASMIRGDASLPFKDVVRSFDRFTQSVILAIVRFNEKFNADQTQETDFDVVARGATSLMAKELRVIQVDQLAQTLTPEDAVYVDRKKMVLARFKARDLGDLLVSDDEAARRQKAMDDGNAQQQQQAQEMHEAQVRQILADAFKQVAQGQKNVVGAQAEAVNQALMLLEAGVMNALNGGSTGPAGATGGASPDADPAGNPDNAGGLGLPPAGDQGQAGGMPSLGGASASGGGQSVQ